MTAAARERSQVRAPMLIISAAAWILLIVKSGGMAMPTHGSAAMPMDMSLASPFDFLAALQPAVSAPADWALMLVAMMTPLLIAPVRHVRDSSFARRRARAIALFVAGYAAIWMEAGVVLLGLARVIRLAAPEWIVLALATLITLVWQFSPAKQRCLNRCHVHSELAAFGPAADADAFRFGLGHGFWCVGSCWALMLLPVLVSRGHVAVMAVASLGLLAERLDRPMPLRWRLRGPGKATRIAVAQTRLWLQRT